jgi:hypothetical protein
MAGKESVATAAGHRFGGLLWRAEAVIFVRGANGRLEDVDEDENAPAALRSSGQAVGGYRDHDPLMKFPRIHLYRISEEHFC